MQCFKLVNGGYPDRLIVFDSLPERLLKNVRTREVAGLPRSWARWLISIDSTRTVFKTETTTTPDASYTQSEGRFFFRYTPIGKEPCFFVLEYQDINSDKERWHEIGEYLRMNIAPKVQLKEKIEDMAIKMAPDAYLPLSIEPEDVPVINVSRETSEEESDQSLVKPEERIIVPLVPSNPPVEIKKRGRPKKVIPVGV